MVVKVAGTVTANFNSPYKQRSFKRQIKRLFSQLLLLQATPKAVIRLCNEISSDTVKTLQDSCPCTQRWCQGTLASSKREQGKAPWDLARWLLSITDLLNALLRMVTRCSGVKCFKSGRQILRTLSIWLREEGHNFAGKVCARACKHSPRS